MFSPEIEILKQEVRDAEKEVERLKPFEEKYEKIKGSLEKEPSESECRAHIEKYKKELERVKSQLIKSDEKSEPAPSKPLKKYEEDSKLSEERIEKIRKQIVDLKNQAANYEKDTPEYKKIILKISVLESQIYGTALDKYITRETIENSYSLTFDSFVLAEKFTMAEIKDYIRNIYDSINQFLDSYDRDTLLAKSSTTSYDDSLDDIFSAYVKNHEDYANNFPGALKMFFTMIYAHKFYYPVSGSRFILSYEDYEVVNTGKVTNIIKDYWKDIKNEKTLNDKKNHYFMPFLYMREEDGKLIKLRQAVYNESDAERKGGARFSLFKF